MAWIDKITLDFLNTEGIKSKKNSVPKGIWHKCPECKETIYSKDLIKDYKVCAHCNYHFFVTPKERIDYLVTDSSFQELFDKIKTEDPLDFEDTKPYPDKIKKSIKKTGYNESVTTGTALIAKKPIALAVLNFEFMGGSMGSVLGEKITRLVELAIDQKLPLVVISSSGGARMQEGTLSLMQMTKTSMALNLLKENKLPYISILTNPTMGGVSASFAMLGDLIIAEPGALIGFAGPRVIEKTIRQKLPKDFQKSEFQLNHGGIDAIVHRKDLQKTLANLLSYLTSNLG